MGFWLESTPLFLSHNCCSHLLKSVSSGWNTCEAASVPHAGVSFKNSNPEAHSKLCTQNKQRGVKRQGLVGMRKYNARGEERSKECSKALAAEWAHKLQDPDVGHGAAG